MKELPDRVELLVIKIAAAILIGVACGLVGTLFHLAILKADAYRRAHDWMIFLMPVAGLLIVAVYKLTRSEGHGTDSVVLAAEDGKLTPKFLLPAIFIGSVLTHLTGGSAGREGAALQMGGQIGYYYGKAVRADRQNRRDYVICGMAGFFSALFGTPLGATVFALGIAHAGFFFYDKFLATFLTAMTAYLVSLMLNIEPTRFSVIEPELDTLMLVRVLLLGILCSIPTILFCQGLHVGEQVIKKYLKNEWLRAAAGGCAVAGLCLLYGSQRYCGTGFPLIVTAIEKGEILPWDWLLKTIFTVITLGCGFKGGEVVPSFFIGAAFGCWMGPILGIPAGLSAAIGLACVFCGCTNCLMATIFLCVEMFGGGDRILYFTAACSICYIFSGRGGFYRAQGIFTSRPKAEVIHNLRHPY